MRRRLLATMTLLLAAASAVRAEFRQVDLTIFGMD